MSPPSRTRIGYQTFEDERGILLSPLAHAYWLYSYLFNYYGVSITVVLTLLPALIMYMKDKEKPAVITFGFSILYGQPCYALLLILERP